MPTSPAARRPFPRWLTLSVAASAFLAVCLGPYLTRLRSPSLYADDIERVIQLQNGTPGEILFVPFNEHIAPLFQAVSWLSWRAAGGRLARAPLVFTLASFLPFLPTLGLLAWVVRRETQSTTAALACVAVMSLSWLPIEAVYWYSASSFQWALLAALAAWLGAASAAEAEGKLWPRSLLAGLASAAAPAFSAIGMLAGPVAAVRVLASPGGRRLAALAPLGGTLFTLALYAAAHDRAALASNVGRSAGVVPGLLATARAPAVALVPALVGVRTWSASGSVAGLQIALTAAAVVTLLIQARRVRDRPLFLGGLALILGGYALTFCARAGEPGRGLLETQRYHLFPMLGLVMVLAPFFRLALARWDARPVAGVWVVTGLAAVLFVLHEPEMRGRARFLRYPDQTRTLAAIDRLSSVCTRAGVTRAQALASLDPVESAWTPAGRNALALLASGSDTPTIPDHLVKPTLLAALTPDERRCLCGGMDATPYLRAAEIPASALAVGRRVALYRVSESGPDRYVSAGWPSFIEYELPSESPTDARALGLSGSEPVEVWWRGDRQKWSETRSVRLRPTSDRPWLLPLDQLPHWDCREARRIRFLFHDPGPIAVRAPRLVR